MKLAGCAIGWRAAVLRHRRTPDSTRVLLLFLAEYVRTDETVSVPRTTVAKALGIEPRRVSSRYQSARELGWLHTIKTGQKGVTSVHLIRYPNDAQGDANEHPEKSGLRHPETPETPVQGDALQHPSSYRGPYVGPHRRAQGERRSA